MAIADVVDIGLSKMQSRVRHRSRGLKPFFWIIELMTLNYGVMVVKYTYSCT
jgi:hypothetical protein